MIRLGAKVTAVRWRPGSARVSVGNGDSILAAAVLTTVPLGVLKRGVPAFDPPLTDKDLFLLVMGDARRVTLCTSADLWTIPGVLQIPRDGFDAFWASGPRRITAWCGGPRAAAMRGRSLDALVADAWNGVQTALGQTMPRSLVTDAFSHDWGNDPYSCGAYSYAGVGGENAARSLAQPVAGTLYFAGEACSADAPGSVDGAWRSGEQAAELVMSDHRGFRREVQTGGP